MIVRRVVEARKLARGGQSQTMLPLQSHTQSQTQSGFLLPPFHNNAVSQTQPLTPLAEKGGAGFYEERTALDRRKANAPGSREKVKNWFKKLGTCFR